MSVVSSQILAVNGWENNLDARITEVNAAIAEINPSRHGQSFVAMSENWSGYGGYKVFAADVYVAAFNKLDHAQILECVARANWDEPEAVQLIYKDEIQSEMGEGFKIATISG